MITETLITLLVGLGLFSTTAQAAGYVDSLSLDQKDKLLEAAQRQTQKSKTADPSRNQTHELREYI